jgi:hypothetical protein
MMLTFKEQSGDENSMMVTNQTRIVNYLYMLHKIRECCLFVVLDTETESAECVPESAHINHQRSFTAIS